MAYSDYGGYAYKDGVRVVERSDAVITPDDMVLGFPGIYPGFAMLAMGVSRENVEKAMEYPRGHVILGDGPIYVTMYKQSTIRVYRFTQEIELYLDRGDGDGDFYDDKHRHAEVDGYTIDVHYLYEDNFYLYARLQQPDGTTWHGFSGYGVGAGLEDADYGFSTKDRIEKLDDLWPDAIAERGDE